MIVRSVTIKNIRSFREEVTINPHPDMNVLIGSNGSDTEGTGHFVSLGNAFVLEEILSQEAANDGRTVNLYIMVQG